ncbi:ECF RNA polymerase sigma factor SigW [Stieleria varia]|uniref:ECF RNA polymerase sigma factor SigW n=1 Tax=Stieleria varia TaxID=2528005 RepID=A0A5C6APT4_9BACT|nr:ECF RNA polymerase sigma factor SigW [Stieleria varia]
MDENAALSKMISPIKDRMFATVWRILRHPQDAEDALQNALVAVWRRQAQVKMHPAPQALILRICADAAIDLFRRRRMDHVDVNLFEGRLTSDDLLPLENLVRDERLDNVMAAISRLSPHQATAIVMKYIQAEPHAQIAEALDCSIETVREHLSRGRTRLERMLANLGSDPLPRKVTSPNCRENKDE